MSNEIRVPILGESVVEATVGKWEKQVGDRVAVGDLLVDLETDKVNLELRAEADGVLQTIERQTGSIVNAAAVVLVAAMRQGPSPRRVRELSERFGADRRTIDRWRVFWQEVFPQTEFWKTALGRLSPALDMAAALPRALLDAFVHTADSCKEWGNLLCFLSPVTITGGLKIKVS